MSKVYILYQDDIRNHSSNIKQLVGVVTKFEVASKWSSQPIKDDMRNCFTYVELDDPELLNRIAKENKNVIST